MPTDGMAPAEKSRLVREYRKLLRMGGFENSDPDRTVIRKALDLAVESHKNIRRKSGELYIFHPIEVAQICVEHIGLGTTSVVCALLHDVVEDTDITLDEIRELFGETVAKIIDGLTKIDDVFDQTTSVQAENFRKIVLTLSDDVRVILIKLADRLHNMRTLGAMPHHKQLKIASETLFLYAPLAHRLGLYSIKSELEDLSLKYKEPKAYEEITTKLQKSKSVRTRFINQFSVPIKRSLEQSGIYFDIKGRTKSVFSIWRKMTSKNLPLEEIYDVFAIRIILEADGTHEMEKALCWKAYSIVTDYYQPNPDRLRDWISAAKTNGYESLHTTVMSPTGKWVEVQIRTRRMDEMAEKGVAAHWKYKEAAQEKAIDEWIGKVREILENPEADAVDFIQDFKLDLFTDEIYVFTPTGELKNMAKGSTALDFAFEIHSQIGERCIGAKVNHKLVPISYELQSGDQIEIITSRKQKPKEDWLNIVTTARAKSKIKSKLNEEKRELAAEGKEFLKRKLKQLKINTDERNVHKIAAFFRQPTVLDLHYKAGLRELDFTKLKLLKKENGILAYRPAARKKRKSLEEIVTNVRGKADTLVIGEDSQNLEYTLSNCCTPIPGDDVFGFVTVSEGIKIHRVNCPNAVQLMSNYAYRIVKAKWVNEESLAFLSGLKVQGFDDMGLVNEITKIISEEAAVNMRSIKFDSTDGVFDGEIMLFVNDTKHLDQLIKKIKKVTGVTSAMRIQNV